MGNMSKKNEKKQNALKHGVYSREAMLPGEKFGDYEALRAAHREEWVPDGVIEEYLVDELVALLWKKQRMNRYDQIRLQQRVAQIHFENDVNRHRTNLKNLAAEFNGATSVEVVEQIFSRLSPVYVEIITSWIPLEKCKEKTQWGQNISKFLSDLKPDSPLEGPALFAAMVNPDLMEAEISRSMRLDEAIDRKIKRIMQVKTAKQIFPSMRKNVKPEPKLINASASADPQPPAIGVDEQKPTAPTEILVSAEILVYARPDVGEGASVSQNGVVVEETHVCGDVSASILPDATGNERSDVAHVFAKPELMIESQKSSALCDEIEGIHVSGNGPVSIPPDATENEHSNVEHAKVEVFAERELIIRLQKFSALCDELRERNGYSRGVGLASCI
jgi:hypothetical protein